MVLLRLRLGTLMIVVAVVGVACVGIVAIVRPVDILLQTRGFPMRSRVLTAAVLGLAVSSIVAIATRLSVQIVRRTIVLGSLLRGTEVDTIESHRPAEFPE